MTSHVDPQVVTMVLEAINERYGTLAPIVVTRGQKHEYLGMHFYFSEEGTLELSMIEYIKKMLAKLPESFKGESSSLASYYLFNIKESKKLTDDQR